MHMWVVPLPVQWKISPPAQLGRALAVEPGRLWTESPPAGSPCSLCSPSHTHTYTQWTHPPTTHRHSAEPQQQEHVVGHHTVNRQMGYLLKVSLSLSVSSCLCLWSLSLLLIEMKLHCFVSVCTWNVCVADEPVNPSLSSPTRRQLFSLLFVSVSLSPTDAVFVLPTRPFLLSLPLTLQTMSLLRPQTPPTSTHMQLERLTEKRCV